MNSISYQRSMTPTRPGDGPAASTVVHRRWRRPFHRGGTATAATGAGSRKALSCLAVVGLALGALAQGSINLDNSQSIGRVVMDVPGIQQGAYGGPFGVEVWAMPGTTVPTNLIDLAGVFGPSFYVSVLADGFWHERTLGNQNNASTPGIINLGELDMDSLGVTPKGGSTVIALYMWNTSDPTFTDAVQRNFGPSFAYGGVAFVNPTADYTAVPKPTPPSLSGWTTDLVLSNEIPEPTTVWLVGLGLAAWLLFNRRARPRTRRQGLLLRR